MTKDQREFGQVTSVDACLIKHLLLALLEEFDGLLALLVQIFHEDTKIVIFVQHM